MRKVIFIAAILSLAGCTRESGLHPIARESGLGEGWTYQGDATSVLLVAVQNSFTRDVTVDLRTSSAEYQLIEGPVRERFIVIPKGDYDIKVSTLGPSSVAGYIHFYQEKTLRNGLAGLLLKVRP